MEFGFVCSKDLALSCDLYELTMAQIYFEKGMNEKAVFDFFVRPDPKRSFYLFAGLEQLLFFLEHVRFGDEAISYLERSGKFSADFLEYLRDFRFKADVRSFEEGEIFLAGEPVVSVEAPLIQAQIVETFLINILHYSILVATKAARCFIAAKETKLVDFGLRRAHGADAGMKAARNSYLAGFSGTSNMLAGKKFGIPVFGTMAHSFVLAHDTELEAFIDFLRYYGENAVLLVDTYDTLEGVKRAIEAVRLVGLSRFKGIRLDSGDIVTLSKEARKMLDEAGFSDAIILVSGGLNEYKIEQYLLQGAPVDGWGVGTELAVSADMPYLDCAYKLVEYAGKPKMKKSVRKVTLPGKKRVCRKNGLHDLITLYDEKCEEEDKLRSAMKNGSLAAPLPTLEEIRQRAVENIHSLPTDMKNLRSDKPRLPRLSTKLKELMAKIG